MTTKTKTLSCRPLRREVKMQAEVGPYHGSSSNRPHPAHSFVLWASDLPKRKKDRWRVVLQQLNRPASPSDYLHNPVLWSRTVVSPADSMPAFRAGQKSLYYAVKSAVLQQRGRSVLRFKIDYCGQTDWDIVEPGANGSVEGWRKEALAALGGACGVHEENE